MSKEEPGPEPVAVLVAQVVARAGVGLTQSVSSGCPQKDVTGRRSTRVGSTHLSPSNERVHLTRLTLVSGDRVPPFTPKLLCCDISRVGSRTVLSESYLLYLTITNGTRVLTRFEMYVIE